MADFYDNPGLERKLFFAFFQRAGLTADSDEASLEPIGGEDGDFFQGAGFFEEVAGARDGDEFFDAGEFGEGLAIEVENAFVAFADDEERGAFYFGERGAGEIGPATTGDDGVDAAGMFGGGLQGGSAARAGTEQANFEALGVGIGLKPGGGVHEAAGKEFDIETQM